MPSSSWEETATRTSADGSGRKFDGRSGVGRSIWVSIPITAAADVRHRRPGSRRRGAPVEPRADRADVRRARAPRPGLARRARRAGRRARHPAPADHRPRDRRPADLQRGPLGRRRPQRRDLQLPRAARRPRAARPPLRDPGRHRGDRPPLRGGGRRTASARCAACSPSRSGTSGAGSCSWSPRPGRQEAALLRRARRRPELRLRARRAAGGRRDPARDRPSRARLLPRLPLRPGAAERVPRACASCRPRTRSSSATAQATIERYWRLDYAPKRDGDRPRASCTRSSASASARRSRGG